MEQFEVACNEMKKRGYQRIGIYGNSKGAGMALLAASVVPDISLVVAASSFGHVMQGTGKPKDVILPAVTLAIPMAARYIRLIRTQMLEELGQEYVTAALSRGVSYLRIILCHILPNSFLGLLTMLGMSFGNLFGGTAVIEAIFNWQGVGYMAVNSVQDRDYNMIQGYALWMGLIFIGLNLLVDVLNLTLDPRRRLGSGEK